MLEFVIYQVISYVVRFGGLYSKVIQKATGVK